MVLKFRPDPKLKTLYGIYAVIGIVIGYLSWAIPLTIIFTPQIMSQAPTLLILIYAPLIVIIIFLSIWISKFYNSIFYSLMENELVVEKGVIWKKKNIIPYSKITNVDVSQGPLERALGIASIRIQTAGYSGAARPEASLIGIRNYERLKNTILEKVRKSTSAIRQEKEVSTQILEELKTIRDLLEKKKKKKSQRK